MKVTPPPHTSSPSSGDRRSCPLWPRRQTCWKRLEEQVRKFALHEGEIMVVTGPVLPKEKSITIGNNKVTVPDRYYKVVYDLTPPQKMIGFIIPNNGSTRPLQDFAVTVDAVEKETGLNFFSLVPRQEQDRLESTITLDAWSW
ncbi:DNA/RNA non-specific endonuclease [Victivallis lenta]|uniref:DNA/RNA non-specific endonuclease n=1 Tax=Victivallis lenta TaxID=2606640 RepID=UPI001F2A9667|nr:DNA/RNA non-specific endonuclease [Victivallis lenta]